MESQNVASAPFVFVGGALVLDFINTEIVERGKPRDLLQTSQDMNQWWQLAASEYEALRQFRVVAVREQMIEAIHHFRAMVRHLFEALAEGGKADENALSAINTVLRGSYQKIAVTEAQRFYRAHHSDDPLIQWLLPIALSATDLLTTYEPARLHKCHNQRCVLLFYDTTKSGTRQWCSLACLERERSSRRYRERKAESDFEQNKEA